MANLRFFPIVLRVACLILALSVASFGAAQAGVLTTLNFGGDSVDEGFSRGDPTVSCSDVFRICFSDKTQGFTGHRTIEHVSLTATLSNPFSFGELSLDLRHNGVTVFLVDFHGGQGSVTITFDDLAAGPLPFSLVSGTFRPDDPLSAFNGLDASGDWTLRISDNDSGDCSSYSNAVLAVTTPAPATLTLLALGLAGLGFSRRRKH